MTMAEMKKLQEEVLAAAKAADDAVKARDGYKVERAACEDEAKQAELDKQIETAEKMYQEKQKAVLDLEAKVDAAGAAREEEKRREAVLAKMSGIFGDAPQAQPNPSTQPKQDAEAKDWDAYGTAQMGALRLFIDAKCSKTAAGLDGEKCAMLEGNSYNYSGSESHKTLEKRTYGDDVAVLPRWFSGKILGDIFSKTIYSIDDATNNPSLANNLVPQEFKNTLLQLPMPPATILPWVTRVPTNTGELTWPRLVQSDTSEFGGIVMRWITQLQEKPETEPVFAQDTIACQEVAGYTELHHKILIRSSIALEPLLASLFRAAIALELERVIIHGDGTSQPLGVIHATGVHTHARAAAGAVGWADCKHLKHELQFYHRDGARFVIGDGVEEDLEDEVDGQNRPLFSATVSSGPYDRLSGYPYNISYNSPALGSDGDVIFGVWKYYFLVVEEDIMIAKSDHYKFRDNVRAVKVFMNVGGKPIQPRAFAYLAGVGGS